jgi:hypothetical protein
MLVDELGHEPARRHDRPPRRTDIVERAFDQPCGEPLTAVARCGLGVREHHPIADQAVVGDRRQHAIEPQLVATCGLVVANRDSHEGVLPAVAALQRCYP